MTAAAAASRHLLLLAALVAGGAVAQLRRAPIAAVAEGTPGGSSKAVGRSVRLVPIEGEPVQACRCLPRGSCPKGRIEERRQCSLPVRTRRGLLFSRADIQNRAMSQPGVCCRPEGVTLTEIGGDDRDQVVPELGEIIPSNNGDVTIKASFNLALAAGARRPVFSETVISGGRRGERALLERSRLPAGSKLFLRRVALDSGDNVARRAVAAPRRRSRLFSTVFKTSRRNSAKAAKSRPVQQSAAAPTNSMRFLSSVGVLVKPRAPLPPPSATTKLLVRNFRAPEEAQRRALEALQLLQQTKVEPSRPTGTAHRRVKRSAAAPPFRVRSGGGRFSSRRAFSASALEGTSAATGTVAPEGVKRAPSGPADTCKNRLPGRCVKREKGGRCLQRRYGVCIRRGGGKGRCIKRLPGKCLDKDVQNCKKEPVIRCSTMARFRSINGQCNNLGRPRWGRQLTGLRRLFDNSFEDGVFAMRSLSTAGGLLPNPRAISLAVFRAEGAADRRRTMSVVTFGQFVDHDLSLSPIFESEDGIECCRRNGLGTLPLRRQHPQCRPFTVAANDPFYRKKKRRCISFVRSLPALNPECLAKPATQVNQLTSWADLSQVYGSTEDASLELRSFSGGALRTSKRGNFLPPDPLAPEETLTFLAGDGRVTENLLLAMFHTVFLREHNRVAATLAARHSWDDERLFQEARRIVIAEYQHIVFGEWLPALLGEQFSGEVGLSGNHGRDTYAAFLNPSISTEFSTAGFRLHSMVQGIVELVSRVGAIRRRIPLPGNFFRPDELVVAQQLAEMARGVTRTPAKRFDGSFAQALRGDLFLQTPNQPGGGLDLTSLNIQRGRDHGIPTYATVAGRCNSVPVNSWSDLEQMIPAADVRRLRAIYRHWSDVDLFAGLNLERLVAGGMVGPTTRCIITDQFLRTRYGDRFFYDRGGQRGSFSRRQLRELRRASWARLLCDNVGAGFNSVQPRAFVAAGRSGGRSNREVSCSSRQIKRVDLSKF